KWCSSSWGPLLDEAGRQIGVQGRERDITVHKELEGEILEISSNERRTIGHELHDGLCQYLAGIAFRAKALEETLLAEGSLQAREAREITTFISCDMKLHSVLLGWKKFLTKSCVSPQVLHGSMRLTGDARESVTVRGMKPSR